MRIWKIVTATVTAVIAATGSGICSKLHQPQQPLSFISGTDCYIDYWSSPENPIPVVISPHDRSVLMPILFTPELNQLSALLQTAPLLGPVREN
ncbi:MAG: hypothetical protein LBJ92_01510 [Holosporales bacterium]|jgi:hypothetical protein|nr:hypothetical protein [Holosporales bacterium]